MAKFKSTLELPAEDLKTRREVLEEELKLVVKELAAIKITKDILLNLDVNNVPFTQLNVEWDFYPESDDEGGSVYYPSISNIETDIGDKVLEELEIEINEFPIKIKYSWSDTIYESTLGDLVSEILSEYSSDLYEYDVYSISIDLSKEAE